MRRPYSSSWATLLMPFKSSRYQGFSRLIRYWSLDQEKQTWIRLTFLTTRLRAIGLGFHPNSAAAARTFARVFSGISALSFKALETVEIETPAWAATS